MSLKKEKDACEHLFVRQYFPNSITIIIDDQYLNKVEQIFKETQITNRKADPVAPLKDNLIAKKEMLIV